MKYLSSEDQLHGRVDIKKVVSVIFLKLILHSALFKVNGIIFIKGCRFIRLFIIYKIFRRILLLFLRYYIYIFNYLLRSYNNK